MIRTGVMRPPAFAQVAQAMKQLMVKTIALLLLQLGCIGVWNVAPRALAQEVSPLDRVMELNRNNEWEQAVQYAQSFLDTGGARTLAERCQAYASIAYSQTRLDRITQAQATLKTFDRTCRELPRDNWLHGLADRIRREINARTAPARRASLMSAPRRPVRDDFWQVADPASLAVSLPALERHKHLCERTNADACLVVYQGKIIQELYSARYHEPTAAMSSTKSVTGLLVGMLIDDGKIRSMDEPVCTYISEWCAGRKAKVTLRHLLTMTSGLPERTTTGVGYVGDKNPYVIAQPLEHEPGTVWAYSNEGVQLLSPILDKAAGEPIQDYARKRLFEPLGMRHTRLRTDMKGHAWTYADMGTTARDFARIGMLMMNKGTWEKRRILSEAWVEQSTKASQALNPRYGLLWWLFDNPKGYGAQGYLDTNLYVFPERDLIVVRMQAMPGPQQLSYEWEALPLFNQLAR
jgi:CubicO group peptidase (beta-lactamase class C family)